MKATSRCSDDWRLLGMIPLLLLVLAALVLMTACSSSETEEETEDPLSSRLSETPLLQAAPSMPAPAAYSVSKVVRTPANLAARAEALASVLVELSSAKAQMALGPISHSAFDASSERYRVLKPFPANQDLLVSYNEQFDELRVTDMTASERASNGLTDLPAANELFHRVLARCVEIRLLPQANYVPDSVEVSTRESGVATDTDPLVLKVEDYRLTIRPQVRGIEWTGARLKVAITTGGDLAFVSVMNPYPPPLSDGIKGAPARVSVSQLEERIHREIPDAVGLRSLLSYHPLDTKTVETFAPRYMVSYSRKFSVDGAEVISRKIIRSYSADDIGAPPVDLAPIVDSGDTTTR